MRIEDVHNIRLKRAKTNHETYKQLFAACCERIKRRVSLPNPPTAMVYHVPAFVWGRPPFKHSHAVRYVSDKLRRNGFHVSETAPGALHVEWTRAPPPPKRTKSRPPPPPPAAAPKPSKLSARLAALRKQLAGP